MNKVLCAFACAVLMVGCASEGENPAPVAKGSSSTPAEASPYEAPKPETVALDQAKKGDLIELPTYPGVGAYGGTADVRGKKTFTIGAPVIARVHSFSPSVLIGSPGQKIVLTVPKEKTESDEPTLLHDFTVSYGPTFSDDKDQLSRWKVAKGTEFTVTFPDEGEVGFYCSIHLRINMAGMLVVKN